MILTAEAADVYISLIHHPVYNKNGEKITTTVTNLDLHDISRAARTYQVKRYYVVNRVKSQRDLVRRMRDYWTSDHGSDYNPSRHEAFQVLDIVESFDEVLTEIEEEAGERPITVTTSAQEHEEGDSLTFARLRSRLKEDSRPYLLLFGTGWGLTEEMISGCDFLLEPVEGPGDFNHLSVRTAAAIIMDRLLGERWWK